MDNFKKRRNERGRFTKFLIICFVLALIKISIVWVPEKQVEKEQVEKKQEITKTVVISGDEVTLNLVEFEDKVVESLKKAIEWYCNWKVAECIDWCKYWEIKVDISHEPKIHKHLQGSYAVLNNEVCRVVYHYIWCKYNFILYWYSGDVIQNYHCWDIKKCNKKK